MLPLVTDDPQGRRADDEGAGSDSEKRSMNLCWWTTVHRMAERRWQLCWDWCGTIPVCSAVELAKNAGQHNAVIAGLNAAKGDAFIAMDDDMQTHPSQLKYLTGKV